VPSREGHRLVTPHGYISTSAPSPSHPSGEMSHVRRSRRYKSERHEATSCGTGGDTRAWISRPGAADAIMPRGSGLRAIRLASSSSQRSPRVEPLWLGGGRCLSVQSPRYVGRDPDRGRPLTRRPASSSSAARTCPGLGYIGLPAIDPVHRRVREQRGAHPCDSAPTPSPAWSPRWTGARRRASNARPAEAEAPNSSTQPEATRRRLACGSGHAGSERSTTARHATAARSTRGPHRVRNGTTASTGCVAGPRR